MADTLTARRAPAPPAPAVPSTFTFDAIGTRWCIDTDEPLNGEVRDRILDRIRRFDRTYSRFRPDSLVAQVAAAPAGGRFEFPEDSVALFDLYDRLVTATEGAVDRWSAASSSSSATTRPIPSRPPLTRCAPENALGQGRPGRRTSSGMARPSSPGARS